MAFETGKGNSAGRRCLPSFSGQVRSDSRGYRRGNYWSYLAIKTNDVSLVQNVAINLHKSAETIVKIDEDIFVAPDTIRDTVAYFHDVCASGLLTRDLSRPC